jgi:membrane associated rhomboid family serine protease
MDDPITVKMGNRLVMFQHERRPVSAQVTRSIISRSEKSHRQMIIGRQPKKQKHLSNRSIKQKKSRIIKDNKLSKSIQWISWMSTCGKQPGRRIPLFIISATIVQIVIFIIMVSIHGIETLFVNPLIGPNANTLVEWGAKDTEKIAKQYQIYRFFSPVILHSGVVHLLFNMLWQVTIALRCEVFWGIWRVAIIYILSGIGGNLLSCALEPESIGVGASSCLSGIFTAMLVDLILNWNNKHVIPYPLSSLINLTMQIIVFIAVGFLPIIDNYSHIGGMIVGFLTASLILSYDSDRLYKEDEVDIVEIKRTKYRESAIEPIQSYDTPGDIISHSTTTSMTDTKSDRSKNHLRYPHWHMRLWRLSIVFRLLCCMLLVAYFTLVLLVFYLAVVKKSWRCKACKYLNPSWNFFFDNQ